MRRANTLIVLFGAGLLLSQLFTSPGLNFFQVISFFICFLFLTIAFVATVIIGFVSWRKSSRHWLCPPLFCILFILSFIVCSKTGVSSKIEIWKFKEHISEYEKIVDGIKSGEIPCNSKFTLINTTNLPPGITCVMAARCPDQSVIASFLGEGSSFAGHVGYLYQNSTETNNCISENIKLDWRLNHLTGNWYKFFD